MTPSDAIQRYEAGEVTRKEFTYDFIHRLDESNAAAALGQLPDDLRAAVAEFVERYRPTIQVIHGILPSPEQIDRVRGWLEADAAARVSALGT